MAITITQKPEFRDETQRCQRVRVDFVLSSNYATPGETVDLTAIPYLKVRALSRIREVSFVSPNHNSYGWAVGSTLANGTIKVFSAIGTEMSNGAYGSPITGDAPSMYIEVLKD